MSSGYWCFGGSFYYLVVVGSILESRQYNSRDKINNKLLFSVSCKSLQLKLSIMSLPSAADMEHYYQNCYPFPAVFSWLNRKNLNDDNGGIESGQERAENDNCIRTREFAMAFRSGAYKRYNSISTLNEFKEMICKFNPDRFEIGAIYNKPPKDREILMKSELVPQRKELVFDIDMDDYDSFRTCCQGAQVCYKCWKFITLAMNVINVALSEDFAFHDYLWVFSGRRGAHCWCNDQRAMGLTDIQRRNILDYLNVIKDRSLSKRLNLKRPYHPHLSRSLDMLKPYFMDFILIEQDPWRDDNNAIRTLLPNIGDKILVDTLTKFWMNEQPNRSSLDKWNDIDDFASNLKFNNNQRRKEFMFRLKQWKEDIVMLILYPKLDIEVTRQLIHLLKAPFCVHPATGNICVPIDSNSFTPDKAPKLVTIQEEFNNSNGQPSKSLQPFIDYFQNHITQFNNEFNKKRRLDSEEIKSE